MPEHDSTTESKLPPVTDEAVDAAREALAEFFGFASHAMLPAGGEVFELTNENLLSDAQQERVDELQAELRTFDHETIVIRNAITNEVVIDPKTGDPLTERRLIEPHTKDGVLIKPTYWARRGAANMGDERYAEYVAKGGSANMVRLALSKMTREMLERNAEDSKSNSGS